MLERAEVDARSSRTTATLAACERARKLSGFSFLDLLQLRTLCLEAEIWLDSGSDDKAMTVASRAVFLAEGAGCPRALGQALATRGVVLQASRNPEAALTNLQRARGVLSTEDIGLDTWIRAWTASTMLQVGQVHTAHDLLSRLDPETDQLPPELSVLVHAWSTRTALVLRQATQAEQSLRLARAAYERTDGAVLPSVRAVYEEAELVVGKTGVHRRIRRPPPRPHALVPPRRKGQVGE